MFSVTFPLASISLLQKVHEGGFKSMKAAQLRYDNGAISHHIVLMSDEELNIMAEGTSMPAVMEIFLAVVLLLRLLESRKTSQLLFEQFQRIKSI